MLPTIKIDDKKCKSPLSCRKCLLACPMHVLGLGTDIGVEKYQEIGPEHFVVKGVYFGKCTGCMDCTKVCPTGAISISFDKGGAQ